VAKSQSQGNRRRVETLIYIHRTVGEQALVKSATFSGSKSLFWCRKKCKAKDILYEDLKSLTVAHKKRCKLWSFSVQHV
jgi:hypothetical protein